MGWRVQWRFWWMWYGGLDSRLRGNDGVVGALRCAGPGRPVVLCRVGWGGLARDERAHAGNAAQRAIYPLVLQSGQSVSG